MKFKHTEWSAIAVGETLTQEHSYHCLAHNYKLFILLFSRNVFNEQKKQPNIPWYKTSKRKILKGQSLSDWFALLRQKRKCLNRIRTHPEAGSGVNVAHLPSRLSVSKSPISPPLLMIPLYGETWHVNSPPHSIHSSEIFVVWWNMMVRWQCQLQYS